MGLPGDRAFDPAETAIERVGWWVSQLMTWRIAEKDCWKRHMVPMRYVNPSDLVYDHYGNCGELQDVWSGTGRTAMIAIWNTGTIADDHMWNEFWQGERWHPVQVDWSDNDTRVGNWGIAYDADTAGAGKTIAALDGWRGDGLNITGLGRYPDTELDGHIWDDYSHHITLEATVEDADGNPVDGALVLIATPGLYDPESLSLTTWQYTGPDGVARITVGEGNDYYVQVTSTLGAIPDPDHVSEWITADEAVADSTHPYTFTLEGTMDLPDPDVVPATGEPTGSVTATIAATREIDHGTDLMTDRTFSEPYASGEVQVLLLTEAEYAGFVGETDFAAVVDMEEGDDIAVDEDLLGAGPFVLVVANKARVVMEQEVAIDVSLYGPAAVEGRDAGDDVEDAPAEAETGEQDVEEDVEPDGAADGADVTGTAGGGGCDCSAAGAGLPGLGPAALAALLLLRRRRHRRPRQEP
jgi:MYXO-CTERM domain-containing protein